MLEGELALDAKGKFLALRVRNHVGIGAYTTQYTAIFGTANTKNCLSSVYRIPAIAHRRQDRADQRGAARSLSRRGPPRGDLPDRNA